MSTFGGSAFLKDYEDAVVMMATLRCRDGRPLREIGRIDADDMRMSTDAESVSKPDTWMSLWVV